MKFDSGNTYLTIPSPKGRIGKYKGMTKATKVKHCLWSLRNMVETIKFKQEKHGSEEKRGRAVGNRNIHHNLPNHPASYPW